MKKISMIQDWDDDHMKKKGFFFLWGMLHTSWLQIFLFSFSGMGV